MAISDHQARAWAEYFILAANDSYEFSDLYEDENFVGNYPDSEDWEAVHDMMVTAKISISWEGE